MAGGDAGAAVGDGGSGVVVFDVDAGGFDGVAPCGDRWEEMVCEDFG